MKTHFTSEVVKLVDFSSSLLGEFPTTMAPLHDALFFKDITNFPQGGSFDRYTYIYAPGIKNKKPRAFLYSLSFGFNANLIPPLSHRGCIKRLASHSRTLSSQPAEATQPPAPNRHQSTPVTNSVCLFMMPICAPGWAVGTGP